MVTFEHRAQPRDSSTRTFSCNSWTYRTAFSRTSSLNSFSCFCLLLPDFFGFPDPLSSSSSSSSRLSSPVVAGRFRPASAGTRFRRVARASLILVRLAFSIREWFWRRMDSRAARDRVLGLRPRRFGSGTSGMRSSSSMGAMTSAGRGEMAGAREGRGCKGRSVPDKDVPVVLGRFARRGGLQPER
jgi:hypothetical protein